MIMKYCTNSICCRSGDVTFIELVDTRSDANLVVNAVIRKLVIPDEELKPALPKVLYKTYDSITYTTRPSLFNGRLTSPRFSVTLCNCSCNLQRNSSLGRYIIGNYTPSLYFAYVFFTYTSLKRRIALQVARKIATCNSSLIYGILFGFIGGTNNGSRNSVYFAYWVRFSSRLRDWKQKTGGT